MSLESVTDQIQAQLPQLAPARLQGQVRDQATRRRPGRRQPDAAHALPRRRRGRLHDPPDRGPPREADRRPPVPDPRLHARPDQGRRLARRRDEAREPARGLSARRRAPRRAAPRSGTSRRSPTWPGSLGRVARRPRGSLCLRSRSREDVTFAWRPPPANPARGPGAKISTSLHHRDIREHSVDFQPERRGRRASNGRKASMSLRAPRARVARIPEETGEGATEGSCDAG